MVATNWSSNASLAAAATALVDDTVALFDDPSVFFDGYNPAVYTPENTKPTNWAQPATVATNWSSNSAIDAAVTTYDNPALTYDSSATFYDSYNAATLRLEGTTPTNWADA